MSGIAREAWLEALRAVDEAPLVDNDPDAVTMIEFGLLLSLGRLQAWRRMRDLLAAGKAIPTKKRIRRPTDGVVMWVPAYKLVKEAPDVVPAAVGSDPRRRGTRDSRLRRRSRGR